MKQNQQISFISDPDIAAQQAQLQRSQALAQMLMQGSNEPLPVNQTAGRYVVPVSPFQGLAKIGQAALAGYGMNQADTKQQALAQMLQQKQQEATAAFPKAREIEMQGPTPSGDALPPGMQQPSAQDFMGWAQKYPTHPMAGEVMKGALGSTFDAMKPYSLRANEKRYDATGNVIATNQGPVTVTRTEQVVNPTTGKPDTLLFKSDGSQSWLGAMPYERPGEFRQILETIPEGPERERILRGYLAEKAGLPTERSVAEQRFRATQQQEGQGPIGPYFYQRGGEIAPVFGQPIGSYGQGTPLPPQQAAQAPSAGAPMPAQAPAPRAAPAAPAGFGGGGFAATGPGGQPNKVQVEARNSANNVFIKDRMPAIEQEGANAATSNAELQALRPMFDKTGWAAPAVGWASQVLSGLGLGGQAANALAADKEKFASFVFTNNWRILGEQKGPQTEGDSQRAMATYVQYKNRPESNQFIADWMEANNNKKIARMQWVQQNYDRFEAQGNVGALERAWKQSPEGKMSVWEDPVLARWKNGPRPAEQQRQLPVPANSRAGAAPDGAEAIREAFRAGRMTRDQAKAELQKLGYQ